MSSAGLSDSKPVKYGYIATGYSVPVSPVSYGFSPSLQTLQTSPAWIPKNLYSATLLSVSKLEGM